MVNISVWAVFGAANTAAPLYSPVLTIISILTICLQNLLVLLAQLHQYTCATDIVAPINCATVLAAPIDDEL